MPRAKKQEAVIPSASLVASAVRYPGSSARIYRPNQNWQGECYRHYAICGEARFAAKFFGNALSRATLHVATRDNGRIEPSETGAGVDTLNDLFNGKDGQEQMLSAIGTHLTIAGECYLVGRTIKKENARIGEVVGEEMWEVVSILEMQVSGSKWSIRYGDTMQDVVLTDDDVVIRIWIPDPAHRIEADSPFRSLLPVLSEIEWLTRHTFAQISSRLAGAGILFLPQSMSFPPPPKNSDGTEPEVKNEAEGFMLTLADGMLTPIEEPSNASAMVPIVVTAPDDAIDKSKLMQFWSDLDAETKSMRQDAIHRFALGMDLPPEQVMGMSSNPGTGGGNTNGVSHWGAWQIEESTIKLHIEPMLEVVCNALTIAYLRPLAETDEIVHYNTAKLRLRPDRSKEAFELYDRGAISLDALLREVGFDTSDKMADEEYKTWLLRKVASGSATPDQVGQALKAIGVDLGEPAPSSESEPDQETRESRPPPSLEEHPARPRTPAEHPEAAALLAASDALVFRALERGGNRIRQKHGVKPPGVPSYEMHTMYQVNGDAAEILTDAWSCAPQVLSGLGVDVDSTVQMLDSYCRALMAEQSHHSRERLHSWIVRGDLEAAS